ncbi:glycosyltransferase family 4 protein [bacterium]|nr:glycosyltransferase family 4 protein [bacterium]
MSIKIGIVGTVLKNNKRGFESYVRQLLTTLACLEGDFSIILYTDKELPEFAELKKITVRVIPRRGKMFFWRNLQLPYFALKDRIDVMHFPDNAVWFIPWKPTIVTLHDISPLLLKNLQITSARMLFVIRIMYFFICKNARLIITDSETSRKDILSFLSVSPEKIVTVPLACPNIFIEHARKESTDVKKSVKKSSEQYVLFVGGVDRRKNVIKLVEAVEILRSLTKKNIRLILAGVHTGSKGLHYISRDTLVYDTSIEGFLILRGHVRDEELIQLYKGASVFVLPSLYEGFGLTVLEAMSCRTPVIVSDSEWGREITGGNAVFVDPHDAHDIARGIQSILADEKKVSELVEKAAVHFQQFSWQKTAALTLEHYKRQVTRCAE